MGLLASFSVVDDLGYPEYTSGGMGIPIDYSDGCEVFAETFESVAKDLVPVDTGTLQGSISAAAYDDGCDCEADCEYAQYVEYGTTYMGAQPYFEPAIEAAYDEAAPYWHEAISEAAEEEAMLMAEADAADAANENMTQYGLYQATKESGVFNNNGIVAFGGNMIAIAIAAIIVGLFQGFLNMVTGNVSNSSSDRSRGRDRDYGDEGGGMGGAGDIPIEIT